VLVLRSVGSGGLGSLDLEIDGALNYLNSITGSWVLFPLAQDRSLSPTNFFFARF
jgi:hypothetical protein